MRNCVYSGASADHLYRAVALERGGASGLGEARRAYALNPYDQSVVPYLVMSEIAAASRMAADSTARGEMLSDARRVLHSNRFLFASGDPWIERATAVLADH